MKTNQTLRIAVILLLLAGGMTSCKDNEHEKWTVQLKLKPQAGNENYLATENPEIKALASKHGVTFYQSYPEFSPSVFLLYYTLMGNRNKENIVKDFLNTDLFDGNVREHCIHFGCGVDLRLKPQADENYLATEDPEIQALVAKYNVTFKQVFSGAQNPELLLYYELTNGGNREVNMPNAIKSFLSTEKFENSIREFEIIYPGINH